MPIEETRLHAAMDAFYPGEDWRKDLGCALDTSLRDMTAAIEAADAAPTILETPRMLVLSTSHIEYRTSLRLDGKRSGAPPLHFPKGEHGWIIPIIPFERDDELDKARWTPDLMKVREFALANGCTWIMLDQAGDVIEGLPSYDW